MNSSENRQALLEVRNLRVEFPGKARQPQVAVKNASFSIYPGETLALVGESGSGKTTIGRAIVRINASSSGDIFFKGRRINGAISPELDAEVTRKIQMIFQDPMASLNERAKIDYIVAEGLYASVTGISGAERRQRVSAALRAVGLSAEVAERFPHEFSGGQRQRIGIARALIIQPELIIADEPISALDVCIRAQILNLLNQLQQQFGLSYLFIAHDLAVVRYIADRVAVIHDGEIVEIAATEQLFTQPKHPYTRSLLAAIAQPYPRRKDVKTAQA